MKLIDVDKIEHDCSKCPYKRLCKEIEIKDLSCEDIKRIAQGSAEG